MDQYKFSHGKYCGKTFLEVKNESPTYFIFLLTIPLLDLKDDYLMFINYNYKYIDNYVFNIGKYKGLTFLEVRKKYPSYYIFLSKLNTNIQNEYKLFIKYCLYYLTF